MEDLVKELTIDMIPDGDNRIIAETIGVENYYKLCSVVGGSTIYLQKPESVLRPVRDAHITTAQEFLIILLLGNSIYDSFIVPFLPHHHVSVCYFLQ